MNLEHFDSVLDPTGESDDINSASEPSSDPGEDDDMVHTFEPIKLNTMQNSVQSNSEYYMHHADTPRVGNDIAWDQHEISIFNYDSGSEDSDERREPIDGVTGRWLSEASMPTVVLTPDTPQFNCDIHSGRLNNGYMHIGMYSDQLQQEGLDVTHEELNYDHESLSMIIQLDDVGPTEQRLVNSNGYIYEANDQLERMDVQQQDQMGPGEEDCCNKNSY